ncbi:MAG: ribonuclease BN [Deltaproteobacteria bacterium RBG_13_52_11]|nr:MAG: ribonuclease BN [Deltaproteobacteria bacterium RBG_13_52_11]
MVLGISQGIRFLTVDIWRIQQRDFSRATWLLIRQVRILVVALRGLNEDKIQLRASSLTFNSLLSLVPLVAVVFGIAKGFGFDKALERYIVEDLQMHDVVITRIIEFSRTLLETTKGGVIAGIGVILLFWTIIRVLANIESSFNDIWGIRKARTLVRKISDYLSFMLICPFLFVMSSTVTVVLAGQVAVAAKKIWLLGAFSPAIFLMLKLVPLFLLWLMFTFIYIFMPNIKVTLKAGALAGVIAAVLFQFFQLLYIDSQIWITQYNAIYGSFAALPLFLVWLQMSWLIVLLGAEFSFAQQNVETYEFEHAYREVSYSFKKLLSLRIVHALVHNFSRAAAPWTEIEISQELEIPLRLVRELLRELREAKVISQVTLDDDRTVAYQPARSLEHITVQYVIDALEQRGMDDIPVAKSRELKKLSAHLNDFHDLVAQSPANKHLHDI